MTLLLWMACQRVGVAEFELNPTGAQPHWPMAPGAQVKLAVASSLRDDSPFGFKLVPIEDRTTQSTDEAVATWGRLSGLGPVSGTGRDLSGVGVLAHGPGVAEITVRGTVAGQTHSESIRVTVATPSWFYSVQGDPLIDTRTIPAGALEVELWAQGPGGEELTVVGVPLDDDFVWGASANGTVLTGRARCESGSELRLAKSEHRLRCL